MSTPRAATPGSTALPVERRARPLRLYLLALIAATALPLVLLSLAQALTAFRDQQHTADAGLTSTARAVSVSVEHLIQSSVSALNMLGHAGALHRGDLLDLHKAAQRALPHQPWYAVWLVDSDGRQVFNTLRPYGTELPNAMDRPYVQEALSTGRPAVSGLLSGRLTKQPHIAIAVPIRSEQTVSYVLVAGLRPTALSHLISPSTVVSNSGIAAILDRDNRLLARSRDSEKWLGQPSHRTFFEAIQDRAEGLVRGRTLEEQSVYTAFVRVPGAGWTVAVGMPADEVELPLRSALLTTGLLATTLLLVASVLATLLSRQIAKPMASLAEAAGRIARGETAELQAGSRIAEIKPLVEALEGASVANAERAHLAQRERALAFQLEAAGDRERRRIAHDLHDDLSQTLAAAQIRLEGLRRNPDVDVARESQEVWALVDSANRSTRSLAQDIAPPVLYEFGLVPALEWLADELVERFKLKVSVDDDGRPKPLSPEAASVLYRATRELLINVAKHARSHTAELRVSRTDADWIVISVRDAGVGFVTSADCTVGRGGLGLASVRERLATMGGTLDLRSAPGEGAEATIRVPLPPRTPDDAKAKAP